MDNLRVFVLFLVTGICFIHGNVDLLPLETQAFVGFECMSTSDITIQFVINETSNTVQTIAECERDIHSCHLVEQSLGKYYAVFYTYRGAIFYINELIEKTRGTYRCCETYTDNRCYNTHTRSMSENITTGNSDKDNPRQPNIGSGTAVIYGDTAFHPLEDQSFDGFECLSNSDISIQFLTNDNANATSIQTIAKCETDLQGCYLLERNFIKYFGVYYTDRGAIFYINGLSEKTWGIYRCCETNNSKACNSSHTWSISRNSTTDKPDINNPIQTNNCSATLETNMYTKGLAVGILTTTGVFIIAIVISVVCVRIHVKKKESSVLDRHKSNIEHEKPKCSKDQSDIGHQRCCADQSYIGHGEPKRFREQEDMPDTHSLLTYEGDCSTDSFCMLSREAKMPSDGIKPYKDPLETESGFLSRMTSNSSDR